MNIAWNPPGLSSAIDRLMDFWDDNVSVPMRRAHPAHPAQPSRQDAPAEEPASNVAECRERHGGPDTAGQGCISALAILAGG